MSSSLRLVPSANHPTTTLPARGAPSAPGVHDTLRANQTSSSTTSAPEVPTSRHPLESRLSQWRSTQETLKMSLLRRQFGIAEPVKRQMELRIVRAGEWRPAALGGSSSGLHADILSGRDTELDWEDVFRTGEELHEGGGFHAEMEAQFGMNW